MSSARKFKIKLATRKARNPLVAPALQRKAGPHRKSQASTRRADKMALKKQINER